MNKRISSRSGATLERSAQKQHLRPQIKALRAQLGQLCDAVMRMSTVLEKIEQFPGGRVARFKKKRGGL